MCEKLDPKLCLMENRTVVSWTLSLSLSIYLSVYLLCNTSYIIICIFSVKNQGLYKGTTTPWPPFRLPGPIHTDYMMLRKILHCRSLHAILFTIFYKVVICGIIWCFSDMSLLLLSYSWPSPFSVLCFFLRYAPFIWFSLVVCSRLKTHAGSRAFSVAVATLWNSLWTC